MASSEASLADQTAANLNIFAERLLRRIPADLAARLSPAYRAALARSAFEFFLYRRENIKVRALRSAVDADELTVIETLMPDCSFIVDSILEYLHEEGLTVHMILHPVFSVIRDGEGKAIALESRRARAHPESFVHAELEGALSAQRSEEIVSQIRSILAEVDAATADFEKMTAMALNICEETAGARVLVELRDFLRWLTQGGFIFLGYRRYRVETDDRGETVALERGKSLGILRDERRSRVWTPLRLEQLDARERALFFESPPLIIGKARAISQVHRRRTLDDITVRRTDRQGQVVGFDRFLGLFTSQAYAEEAQHIPVLRAKLREVLKAEHVVAGSHDFKQLVTIFNSFPKEELFRASVAELRDQLRLVLDLGSKVEARLKVHSDVMRGHVIALVSLPRDRFSGEVRMKIQELLARRFAGKVVYYYLALGEDGTARLHFCFEAPPPAPATIAALGGEVAELTRTWEDRLRQQLVALYGRSRGLMIEARWREAFSAHYRSGVAPERAARDIEYAEAMLSGGAVSAEVEVEPAGTDSGEVSAVRLYELDEAPALSALMPVLQNFGLVVLSEEANELRPQLDGRTRSVFIQSFGVRSLKGQPGAGVLAEALVEVYTHRAENDPLNALTVTGGLGWREVALVRAYLAAAFQMRLAPARPGLRRVLLQHPELARVLVDLFCARFDPCNEPPPARLDELRRAYGQRLSAVENIADDKVARALLAMVEATVRTNYFRPPAAPDPYIALKFESGRIPDLPDVAPLYEIHVNSPRMEGCHLRAGRAARGGIRYSERPDDYRTEVLELMKTQTVKNAIIVPTGAKGGFIVKHRASQPLGGDDVMESYRTLVNAMLDLTDNLVDARIIHPERVKALDNDGPYLVVAADKGTGAFSDIANGIAAGRGFWLGDAFASGGEHGYDHKKLGITARGAWESAKWHLRELGRDPLRGAPIRMVGIGDMSGDVFGNGLLQSANVKLIAAFDHRHIFLDPDPDPSASYAERRRLFELGPSSWWDYNRALISAGGGVFPRGQKRIELSPQARAALGCEAEVLDGNALIKAILRAPVDLLYNGGIGTYVRASEETDAQVADYANDDCRVTAAELRAKIVVEGGNLGFTQKARIEYALRGGRINTDAIDNSGGVDLSDHEVNLKILFQGALKRATLSTEERNRLLMKAADDVAESVLENNRHQVQSLSLEQIRSRGQMSAFREHLIAIEQSGLLRRHEEALPSREELRERRATYPGLTRPELAVLSAYTKIDLVKRLEASALIDDPDLVERFLQPYFPPSIAASFSAEVRGHSLKRELVATQVVNELVDLMGSTFVFSLSHERGIEADEAVRAWVIAAGILDVRRQAERIRTQPTLLTADSQLAALLALEYAVRRACTWALVYPTLDAPIGETIEGFGPALIRLSGNFEQMLVAGERDRFERVYRELRSAVHEEQSANELARLAFADHLLGVLNLAFANHFEVPHVARAYFQLSDSFDYAMLETALEAIGGDDRWERRAARELADELGEARLELCRHVLAEHDGDVTAAIKHMQSEQPKQFGEVSRLLAELRAAPAIHLAAVQVALRALTRLTRS